MNASEIAFKAADYIAKHGWCQGKLQDSEGKVCLEGAIMIVAGIAEIQSSEQAASTLIRELISTTGSRGPLHYWNDHVAESAEDVILLLKQAGHELEGKT